MAILNVKLPTNLTEYPNSFKRQGSFPLEAYSVFYAISDNSGAVTATALEAAQDYAKNNPISYVGQILAVVNVADDGTSTVDVYKIENANGDLVPVGNTEEVEAAVATLEAFIGAIPETSNATTIIEYINEKTSGIATDAALAELQGAVTELQEKSAEIEGNVTDLSDKIGEVADGKTVVEMISDAQTAATYDDTELVDRVAAIEDDYLKAEDKDELQDNIDAVSEVANAAATQAALEAEIARAQAAEAKNASDIALILESPDDDVINSIKEFTQYIADHGDVATGLQTQITENADAIADEKTRAEGVEAELADAIETKANQTDLAGAIERISKNETDIATKADQGDLESAVARIAENETAIAGKVDAVDGKGLSTNDLTDTLLAKLEGIAENAQVNVIDLVDEEQFAIDENKKLTLLDVAMGKVTGLSEALAGKVEKVEGSRLLTSDEATKLEKLVLDEDGGVSVSGTVAAGNVDGLEAWITARAGTLEGLSENNLSDTLLAKLENIADDAQVNVLEGIKVGDTLLSIVDKIATIPVGAADALGVVKSSDAENKVAIAADGVMEVNSVNVNKLVQVDGDYLILNGGAAAI